LTESVAFTVGGALLGLLVSSIFIQVNLKKKTTWTYKYTYHIENGQNEFNIYRMGLLIAAGLAVMWYVERLALSFIEPGLVSIAFYSLQITSAVAALLAGTFASIQFNKSENSLDTLKKYSFTIISINLILMGLVYLIIKEMNMLFSFVRTNNEIISLFRKNIDFFAIYSMASIAKLNLH
jgi:hypothetical protein